MVNCPVCDAHIDVEEDDLDEGDSLVCEECGASLHVAGVKPLDLEEAEEEEEDEEKGEQESGAEEDEDEPWR